MPDQPATPCLTLDLECTNEVIIVHCHGQLVSELSDIFYSKIRPIIPGSKRIVLDLSHVTRMDSMASAPSSAFTPPPAPQDARCSSSTWASAFANYSPHQSLIRIPILGEHGVSSRLPQTTKRAFPPKKRLISTRSNSQSIVSCFSGEIRFSTSALPKPRSPPSSLSVFIRADPRSPKCLPRLRNIRPQHLLRARSRFHRNPLQLQPLLLALVVRLQVILRQSILQNPKSVLWSIGKLKQLQVFRSDRPPSPPAAPG